MSTIYILAEIGSKEAWAMVVVLVTTLVGGASWLAKSTINGFKAKVKDVEKAQGRHEKLEGHPACVARSEAMRDDITEIKADVKELLLRRP